MNRIFSRGSILVALFGSTLFGSLISPVMAEPRPANIKVTQQNSEFQPNMRNAMSSLTEAQTWLETATLDKGGHRVKALALVQQATKETQLGIEYDRTHNNDSRNQTDSNNQRNQDIQANIRTTAQNRDSQFKMQNALSSLTTAQKWLSIATPDKGGHRVQALKLVQQALQETQQGIAFAATAQPGMQNALSSLTEAQRWLSSATSDKGGHRMKALELVQQALKEIQQGIEYDRSN